MSWWKELVAKLRSSLATERWVMIDNVCSPGEVPDAEQRCCYDCAHMKGAVSWWCTNEEAIRVRRTRIPLAWNCEFWAPAKRHPSDVSG